MRKRRTVQGFRVKAISGTHCVIFGFNLPENECSGLLGFSIHRTDKTENEAYYLKAMKAFPLTDPGLRSGSLFSTRDQPIQSFQWADYSAKPNHNYKYIISALKGSPEKLVTYKQVSIHIQTESYEGTDHEVYFNRGISASQAYVRRYGELSPHEVINGQAFKWLSRGLYEALEGFIDSCVPGQDALRICAYEFNYLPFLQKLKSALDLGVDIQIIYDARKNYPKNENRIKTHAAGLEDVCIERKTTKSYISHNKFIVKISGGIPASVWTGGMNFSEGGIFGHSNVSHVIHDNGVAQKYLDFWELLRLDLANKDTKPVVQQISPLQPLPLASGSHCIFSPRGSTQALDFYRDLGLSAKHGLFMTFAFGMNDLFKDVYDDSQAKIRFALLEKKTRPMANGPLKDIEEAKIQYLRNKPRNIFAVGDFIRTNELDGWVKEKISGLNTHVRYVHNKFMLVDPLSNNPTVVTGSANFSLASIKNNDENMLVIRGNRRIADIYFGEFMRLFSHHSFRESLQWRSIDDPPKPLRTDDWWRGYYGNTQRSYKRIYFSR